MFIRRQAAGRADEGATRYDATPAAHAHQRLVRVLERAQREREQREAVGVVGFRLHVEGLERLRRVAELGAHRCAADSQLEDGLGLQPRLQPHGALLVTAIPAIHVERANRIAQSLGLPHEAHRHLARRRGHGRRRVDVERSHLALVHAVALDQSHRDARPRSVAVLEVQRVRPVGRLLAREHLEAVEELAEVNAELERAFCGPVLLGNAPLLEERRLQDGRAVKRRALHHAQPQGRVVDLDGSN